ncbi:I78 family peptidase inhibitor [Novosphingobium rhizovicinum]|uniref:I78 family peptidase inhibitor n=1 Tax=Novosphingobium rhizovicinum TaxID=3228928 RepID=A0ABV3R8R6_9SPHN
MTRHSFSIASVLAAAALAGCTPTGEVRPDAATPPAPSEALKSCGADKLSSYIGMIPSESVLAKMKMESGAQAVRVVGPNDAMTMDYREDRLTIHTNADGRIDRLRCV